MKSTKKILLFSILLAFTMTTPFIFTVFGDVKTSQITVIKFWYTENDVEKPTLLDKVARFEAQNPDVDVQPEQHGFFGVESEYTTAFVAGQEPQVLRSPRDGVPVFAENGMIAPLTAEYTTADLADFLPASIKLMTYKGDIWGFPQAIDCPMYLYNKHLFTVAGFNTDLLNFTTSWTWAQFNTNIAIVNASTSAYALSLAGMFFGAQPYYYGQGGYFLETATNPVYDTGHIAINTTISRTAIMFLKNLVDSSLTPPWTEQGWANFVGDFGQGEVAMIATGPWQILDLLSNHPQFNGTAYGNDNLGFMQVPHDMSGNQGALIGGNYYVVSSQTTSAEYDAAVRLSKFLSGQKMMSLSAIQDYHIPARLSVMTNASVMAAPSFQYIQPYFEQAVNAYLLTPSPYYGPMENAFGGRLDEYLAGSIPLDGGAGLINKTIADWREILPEPPTASPPIPGFPTTVLFVALFIGVSVVVWYIIKKKK
jgi:ABC-type glycerol-3-phosphate transport system substrate-binding protein